MKTIILDILKKYLEIFPEEQERQAKLINYLRAHKDQDITDWNNFEGHIVSSGFVYAIQENKFLVLYHTDLKRFLYPGGHVNPDDKNPLEASKREIEEETGLTNLQVLKVSNDELIPFDIDTHIIDYNKRLDLPEHYHFDFRYLFLVNKISQVTIDTEELSKYKWISPEELSNDSNYEKVAIKIIKLLIEKTIL